MMTEKILNKLQELLELVIFSIKYFDYTHWSTKGHTWTIKDYSLYLTPHVGIFYLKLEHPGVAGCIVVSHENMLDCFLLMLAKIDAWIKE